MQKVINSHCHIYPNKIAARAVEGIGDFYDLHMSLNGQIDDLIKDGNKVGVVHYLIHSVATVPKQVKSINEFIASEVNAHPDLFTGFGTLHPDSENVEKDLDYLVELGLKGIKTCLSTLETSDTITQIRSSSSRFLKHFQTPCLLELTSEDGAYGKRLQKNSKIMKTSWSTHVQAFTHLVLRQLKI